MDDVSIENSNRGLPPEATNAIKMAKLYAESYIQLFENIGIAKGAFTIAPSFYLIQNAQTRHRVASLLDFTGGINGLVIINYPEDTAVDVVATFLTGMGIGKDDCPKHLGEEVVNTLGEIMNQSLGNFRRNLEIDYGFVATSGTPITMMVNSMLNLSPVDSSTQHFYVRVQITTPNRKALYMEFCIQEGVFVKL